MTPIRRCPYCQHVFQPSPYRLQQHVCSEAECQRRRRADYHRQKIRADPLYAQVVKDSRKQWRSEHADYQKTYWQTHPEAAEREHIIAEATGDCYASQLRIERASKAIVHTTIKTKGEGPCKNFEDKILQRPLAGVYTEELVDGVKAQLEISRRRSAAVQRVKLFASRCMRSRRRACRFLGFG